MLGCDATRLEGWGGHRSGLSWFETLAPLRRTIQYSPSLRDPRHSIHAVTAKLDRQFITLRITA
jgi:hypothetical protein